MITEDYVSFETSKLLKENGFGKKFDEFCPYSYSTFLPNSPCFGETDLRKGSMKHQTYAPTIQMAMKWLREVYNIDISVTPDRKVGYSVLIFKDKRLPFDTLDSYSIYEQACEAAIKYCLENLI